MIFRIASRVKKDVNTMSDIYKNEIKKLEGEFNGLSRAKRTLEMAISKRINISNG